ncbi:vesicle-associated membrane protein 5 isoform X1 [Lepus europaeus]|uniref:vesicle-associated membrane protein 5 isoform X1 n=1 Tax=Lepus europaeus TaxID=9983 RepID=UPI002B47C71B|nr:vesicle-associated membrane protein 5 isoform X1 [Lepus europaeus]
MAETRLALNSLLRSGRERVGAMPAAGRRGDRNHAQQLRQGPGARWEAGRATAAFGPTAGHGSSAFSKTTKIVAQKKRWENIRCRIYLGLVVAGGLLIILIVLLAVFLPQNSGDSTAPQAQDATTASGPGE